MNEEKIRKKVKELGPWIHNIDLNGVETKKVSPKSAGGRPPVLPDPRWKVVKRFLPEEDVTCVDLGCNAGGISFKLEELGYEVTGVEINDRCYKQALFAKDVLDSDVNFVQEDVIDFLEDSQVFDYSIALGLVYHVKKPSQFIELLGKKTEKIFLLESRYDDVLRKKWIEEKNGWQLSREWLEEEVKKTGISEIFTATRGGKNLPASGFRLLIAGKF